MNILNRISNLWELSAYHPGSAEEEKAGMETGTKVAMIVSPPEKKIQKAQFIAHVPVDPIKKFVEEQNS